MRDSLQVRPGSVLDGRVAVLGSKNATFPVLAAAMCSPEGHVLDVSNVPDIIDVRRYLSLIEGCGAAITWSASGVRLEVPDYEHLIVPPPVLAGVNRASYYIAPVLAAAHGSVELAYPGGCNVGARGMDLHFVIADAFGYDVELGQMGYRLSRKRWPRTVTVNLPFPSRGATVAAILHAAATGIPAVIQNANASVEARATVIGLPNHTSVEWRGGAVEISAYESSSAARQQRSIPPDKAEAGTLIALSLCSRGQVEVDGADVEALGPLLSVLCAAGIEVSQNRGRISASIDGQVSLSVRAGLQAEDADADWLPPLAGALAWSEGAEVEIIDTINPQRHSLLARGLAAMGAIVQCNGPSLRVKGTRANGNDMKICTAPDIRSGAALVLSALKRPGETRIYGVEHLDRGYERLPERWAEVGAQLYRGRG